VQLYQLGDAEFPPLRSLDGTNLPTQPTPLIGRERELEEAGRLLHSHRLVTLTGPGGSGKTRLAVQLAADAVEDFPDRVVWVPLQSVRDPELVQPTAARVLGRGTEDTLLVLDNFEQVLAAAPKVADLLAQFPKLKLLVTSREALHIGGEREYPVAPLHEREAVALFSERATAAKPDFAEDEAVVEICRRLDCLPLALELAAARVKALSTEQLLNRLDRRLPMLTGGPRDAPERQQTLRATIAWSYELLTADEQRTFACLAVFAGGCTLDAAEEVCETSFDTVAALIDKSLLYREDDRYFMLETIGEYALEQLEDDGELDDVRRRHAEYYLERARSVERLIRSPQAARALDELERDHGNLRAALGWLSDDTADQPLRLAVWGLAARLHGFGDLALDREDASEAARLYRESLEIGLQLKDELQIAYCIAGLAAVDAHQGRLGQAARLWGSVNAFERTSGTPLNDAERRRYERALGEVEQRSETSGEFAEGSTMTLDEAVEYALRS
jgi:predicted ATPase